MLVTYEDINSTHLKITSIYKKYNCTKKINIEVITKLTNSTLLVIFTQHLNRYETKNDDKG
ncbi:hypothetical protein CHRYSEO8AT_30030 [Chryseobacterium sp. 8AT]|nr:hypothetical protein CHRYSEO8AT_30030 [Chryseobacterium sp. 8AT]